MLKKIEFGNYKAFKDEAELEIKPVTILLGKNSSGKSSVCKLVGALSEAAKGKLNELIPLRFGNIKLGSVYDDIFFNRNKAGLTITLVYDEGLKLQCSYLVKEGRMYVEKYGIEKGEYISETKFKSLNESSDTAIKGLIWQDALKKAGVNPDSLAFSVDYIGPLRIEAKRIINQSDIAGTDFVGYDGSNTYEILLDSYLKGTDLFTNVSKWFEENMDGQRLDFDRQNLETGMYSILVRRGGAKVNVADVGEGVAQVLPIITQSYKPNADITIIEQPSLHLNSAAHASVARRVAASAKTSGKRYIIETHSKTFLLALQQMIADPSNDFRREDLVIYYVDHDEESAILRPIEIKENMEYSYWPTGLFEEDYDLAIGIDKILSGL